MKRSERDLPSPAESIPQYIVDGIDRQDPETLRAIATYAEELAAFQEARVEAEKAAARDAVEDDVDRTGEARDDHPEDVPAKANVVIKEINDNRYYYWQWRDGDKIRSKYKGPVDPSRKQS